MDELGGDEDITFEVLVSLLLLNSLSTNTLALFRGAGFGGAFVELGVSFELSFLGDLISSFIFLIMFIEVDVGALGLFWLL